MTFFLFVDLALEIAQEFGFLIYTRNLKALTPLQLIVTIPQVFRSSLELGPAESFLYTCEYALDVYIYIINFF